MMRRHLLGVVACAAALVASQALAQATAPKWPQKTVRIVAAGPAGDAAEIAERILAEH